MKLSNEFRWEGTESSLVHDIKNESDKIVGRVINYCKESTESILKLKTRERIPAYADSKITSCIDSETKEFSNCIVTEFIIVADNEALNKSYRFIFKITYNNQLNIALLVHELWLSETTEDIIKVFMNQKVVTSIHVLIDNIL